MKKFTGIALFVCLLVVAKVSADTIEIAYVGVDAGGQQSLNGSVSYTGANGVMGLTTRNANGQLAELLDSKVWSYCYEIGQNTQFNYWTANVSLLEDAIGETKADLIRQLWGLYYDDSWEAETWIYTNGFVSGQPANTAENQNALAFSTAV